MTRNQLVYDDIRQWILDALSDDAPVLETTHTADEQMERHDIRFPDLLNALRNIIQIAHDYSGGCYTTYGHDIDERLIAVVVAPSDPSNRNRIKVVNVWPETRKGEIVGGSEGSSLA